MVDLAIPAGTAEGFRQDETPFAIPATLRPNPSSGLRAETRTLRSESARLAP
jgi:hypothetical protein